MVAEKLRQFDPLLDELPSRYVVGIDLGTTNSAVAYVDTQETPWQVRTFSVPQLVAPAEVEARETLPSFHYQPAQGELAENALRLPWSKEAPSHVVGFMARDEGTKTPGRLIGSAKSWLCHAGVDRTAELLPWQGAADVERLSPVEASARYVRHIRDAWNARFPREPLSQQDLVITLPASFDEVARELTVEAAARADLPRVVLIEEPQAAFYAWVHKHADNWDQLVEPGQKILVCDIGGGTTDFTLIRVRHSDVADHDDKIQFHRVAVGDHLILGGDNLDLALAHHIERKLAGQRKLEPRQWDVLVRICRRVKETLLGDGAPEHYTVNLPGSGAKLIGGALQIEVSRDEIQQLLVDGYLPRTTLNEKPSQRQSGFQEFGLPYAADPAITRYLAAFLTTHRFAGDHVGQASSLPDSLNSSVPSSGHDSVDPARPDIILFNGGFFASPLLRARLLEVLASWFNDSNQQQPWQPIVLDNDRLDLAVARGAAYYGMVRRGEGVRIAANLARSYYISVESNQPSAVCLVPGNAEPGQDIELADMRFQLLLSQPVEFPLYVSSTRLADRPGEIIPIDLEQIKPLPPIRTVIRTQRRSERGPTSVTLHARLSEIGTIELWCSEVDTDRSWRLQFDIRSTTQTDIAAHETAGEAQGFIDESSWNECRSLIASVFDQGGKDKPEGLVKRLGKALGSDRSQWPTSLLRRIWEALMEFESGRRRSPVHEARWLNLLGYALRPGYGLAVDDWRVAETWRTVQGKLAHHAASSRTESLILWRRVAGGLSAGQQRAVAEPLLVPVRNLHRRYETGRTRSGDVMLAANEISEVLRLLGSLELLPINLKVELGDMLVNLLPKRKLENVRTAITWAVGRLGQRIPLYGPLNTVVPRERAADWLATVMRAGDDPISHLAAMQLARRSDDRHRDLDDRLRRETIDWLSDNQASAHLITLVRDGGQLDSEEQGGVFGDSLPKGLRIQ